MAEVAEKTTAAASPSAAAGTPAGSLDTVGGWRPPATDDASAALVVAWSCGSFDHVIVP